jgi:hypothetical protein
MEASSQRTTIELASAGRGRHERGRVAGTSLQAMLRAHVVLGRALEAPCAGLISTLQGGCSSTLQITTSGAQDSPAGRCFHSSPSNAKPKIAVKEELPTGWKYAGNQKANTLRYQKQMKEYKQKLAILRTAWRPLVEKHNAEVRASGQACSCTVTCGDQACTERHSTRQPAHAAEA